MELVREAPPAPHRGGRSNRVDWRSVAEKLRAEPGEWFVVGEHPHDAGRVLANRLNVGAAAGWTAADFEAVGRRTESGTTKVYARYVGTGA